MTNEEMQKAIEFIIGQQVRSVTRTEKNELRLIKLEDAFVTLDEMARRYINKNGGPPQGRE